MSFRDKRSSLFVKMTMTKKFSGFVTMTGVSALAQTSASVASPCGSSRSGSRETPGANVIKLFMVVIYRFLY